MPRWRSLVIDQPSSEQLLALRDELTPRQALDDDDRTSAPGYLDDTAEPGEVEARAHLVDPEIPAGDLAAAASENREYPGFRSPLVMPLPVDVVVRPNLPTLPIPPLSVRAQPYLTGTPLQPSLGLRMLAGDRSPPTSPWSGPENLPWLINASKQRVFRYVSIRRWELRGLTSSWRRS
jgi:hypothetical protein